MTALAIAVVLVIPVTVLVGLLQLANVRERRRAEVTARQIAVTDAIHATFGPIVAPVVRRGRHGRWIGVLPVLRGEPHVGAMVDIAQLQLGPAAEIVLVQPDLSPAPQRSGRRVPALALSGARFTR